MSSQATILIVDDTPANLDLLFRYLEKADYKVLVAQDGEGAILQAEYAQPDLILLDVMMPNLNGFETCTLLKANRITRDIPVIFMTALSEPSHKVTGFETGGVDYVTKPLEYREVLARISTHLTVRQLQKSLEEKNRALQQEIERHKKTQADLQRSKERYALAARGANDGLWDWDIGANRLYLSPRWQTMLGYQEGALGHSLFEWFSLVHSQDFGHLQQQIIAHLEGRQSHLETEYRILHRDGSYRWMLCRGLAVCDADHIPYRMAGSQTDITVRKQAEERLRYKSTHDALTGLPNRSLFLQRLNRRLAESRQKETYQFALCFIDLDGFKAINDTRGHAVGDQLLVEVARRLQSSVRSQDTVARFGGDEFTILLSEIDKPEAMLSIVEQIQHTLNQPVYLNGDQIQIGASIGITFGHSDYNRPEDILHDADLAMYRAKSHGQSFYFLHPDKTINHRTDSVTA